ncbi:peptidylprolyl isomerase [Arthrobacter gandavensis]|uniref:peptidylprolyl isomerase n=1 Tax=Arthrobacter gandavensis TaxID=169960 RepID=UPI0018901CFB|nr:peptidylprolyl isomerase [Arthrobacter gandavensis]MBF4995325.1 peptidylprolyl isomerase [Arthrobacter gandavensis]
MKAGSKSTRTSRRRLARKEAKEAFAREQRKRRLRDNAFAGAAGALALALAVALQVFWFSSNPTADDLAALRQGAQAGQGASAIPDTSLAAGKTFTGTMVLNGAGVEVELDGSAAPQAAAVFKSLADSSFFGGKDCHRLTTQDTMGVLQCGSRDGTGAGDPDYQWGPVENSPEDGAYPAGTIAVARGATPDSHGTQFFIAYKDSVITQETGGYTIMGKVTSGLEVLEAIAADGVADGGRDGRPSTPVTIDSFTLK